MDGDCSKFQGNVRLMTNLFFNTDVKAFIFSYGSNYGVMGPCFAPEDNKQCYSLDFISRKMFLFFGMWDDVTGRLYGAQVSSPLYSYLCQHDFRW